MISENIRRARRARGLSQEQLAAELHVVRQTVSKWENGISLPDAGELLGLARILDVSVDELLGIPPQNVQGEELARLNAALARLEEERRQAGRAGRVRGLILLLSFAAMLAALSVQNAILSLALTAGCLLAALIILCKNLTLLTAAGAESRELGTVKLTTVFDITLLLLAVGAVVLREASVIELSQDGEKLLAYAIVCAVMLFGGWVSPRLPFNRHTGLRLPWTVTDEQTWNVAHRILGFISLPLTLLYTAAAFTADVFEAATVTAILLWVGIPGLFSWTFWRRKFR